MMSNLLETIFLSPDARSEWTNKPFHRKNLRKHSYAFSFRSILFLLLLLFSSLAVSNEVGCRNHMTKERVNERVQKKARRSTSSCLWLERQLKCVCAFHDGCCFVSCRKYLTTGTHFSKHDIHVENHDFKMNLFVENVTYATLRRAYMHTEKTKCATQRDLDW